MTDSNPEIEDLINQNYSSHSQSIDESCDSLALDDTQNAINLSSVLPDKSSIINLLKESLAIHWKQTHDLTEQSEHLERWGYKKIAKIFKEDAEQEHQHAKVNISRLEFYDASAVSPTLTTETWPRHDMLGIINYNLASVRKAADVEKLTILTARMHGDEITANIMIPLLQGSEDGISLYESYLKMITQMGLENFLTMQV